MYYYDKEDAAILLVLDKPEIQNRFFEEVKRRLAMGGKTSGEGERKNAGNPGMLIFFINQSITLLTCQEVLVYIYVN